MKLTISEGNSKLGRKVPNISLTPGVSCGAGAPCFNDGCYAMKAYRMYPNVRTAWNSNLELWNADKEEFARQLDAFLFPNKPKRFRWHVGGDIPDQSYADMIAWTAIMHPGTSFLCFTKRWDLSLPTALPNLTVVLSMWPGLSVPGHYNNLPTAWLAEDDRAPVDKFHIKCPGHCGDCDYKCWDILDFDMAVIFPKH